MGQSPTDYDKRQTMYLSLLSLCLVGISTASPAPEATPEADPYLIHGYGGLGYPYTYGYNPYFVPTVVKSAEKEDDTETMEDDTKTVEENKIVSPLVYRRTYGFPYGYNGYPSLTHHYIGKREAKAAPEAEADPYLIYGGFPYTYPYLHHPVIKPIKSEAEAHPEAEAEADPYVVHGYRGFNPYTYSHGHLGGYHRGYYGHPYSYGYGHYFG